MTEYHLVVGPPGTGKTHTLANWARRGADTYGADRILITSMTRTAAAAIAARTPDIPATGVATLHALAYRALGNPRLAETPEGLAAWNTAHPARRLTPQHGDDQATDAGKLHAAIGAHRARLEPPSTWTPAERAHHAAWTAYKHDTQSLDFTDLIEQATTKNQPHPLHPAVILIDEAQDLSPLEHQLIDVWGQHAEHVVLVGDPDQALFGFRGADPHALMGRTTTTTRTLEQSWRVPRAVHATAIGYYGDTAGAYQPRDADGASGRTTRSLADPAGIVRLVQARLSRHPDWTIMVLASCRHMIDPVATALTAARIPTHNPYRQTAQRWNNTSEAWRIDAYLDPTWTYAGLAGWAETVTGLPPGVADLIELAKRRGKQPVRDDLLAQALGFGHPALARDLTWLTANLNAKWKRRLAVPIHHAARGLDWTPRVTVGTVHSVKGGEADLVIVAPDISRTAAWNTGRGAKAAVKRIGYVALTRARNDILILAPTTPERMVINA